MPRQKKDGKIVNFYLSREVIERLEKYCKETGQSKTAAAERMMSNELDLYFKQPEGKRVPR